MSGIHFTGVGECIEMKPNLILASRNTGAIESTVLFKFLSSRDLVKELFTIDYKVPMSLLGHLTEIIILRMNAKEAGLILDNLRIRFEES